MPCSTAVKLPPATTWPSVGLLCLCSCTLPYFVGVDTDTDASDTSNSSGSTGATSLPTTGDAGGESTPAPTTGGDTTDAVGESAETSAASTTGVVYDLGTDDLDDFCVDPDAACDADSDDLAHALGLDCGGGIKTLTGLGVDGPPTSRQVVGQLGAEGTYAPRLGSRAVLLSTGVAAHVLLTQDELFMTTECSQIGLPCPSTDYPKGYDLIALPAPMVTAPIDCPKGQPPPADGDCSQTIDAQWQGGDPRLAHDYTELRLTAEVPPGALGVEIQAAMFTSERPSRISMGAVNDLFVVWLESELWTGNVAIHPQQAVPMAVNAVEFDYNNLDPELAGFGFAEHAGTDWLTFAAPVQAGDTVTLVIALFDVADGKVDSAVLLDDLRWTCADPNRGAAHP